MTAPAAPAPGGALFEGYAPLPGVYDESFDAAGAPRPGSADVVAALNVLGKAEFNTRRALADRAFLQSGVTFSVYSDQQGVERIFPFDPIPRILEAADWAVVEAGLVQRVRALDAFLADVYGAQRIVAAGVVPREIIEGSTGFLRPMVGVAPPAGKYIHVSGIDLIRAPDGRFVVLEDNARTPSGVSYVLENRAVLKRVLPKVFARTPVRPVDDYPILLRSALASLAPVPAEEAQIAVLSPGQYNSAYFEHGFLARRMGVPLVHPGDLFVHQREVFVRTTAGAKRVHVLYRRIDDEFLDPKVFRKDSLLGVPGIVEAYAAGGVALANAIGNGVCDDKGVYPYVPAMVRYYLGEEPILGQVPTLSCADPADLAQVLANLPAMVVKAVDASGGYGMLFGPKASAQEIADFAPRIRANPRGYIAQPVQELSTSPTWVDGRVEPRRVDLRPYIVQGRDGIEVLPGGLSRVALVRGSYVVNSSQGGGSKDTWILHAGGVR